MTRALKLQPTFSGAAGYKRAITDINGTDTYLIVPAVQEVPPQIFATGAVLEFTGTSAYVPIPSTSTGEQPDRIRLAATQPCYVRVGKESETSAVVANGGTGYAPADTITLTGGTFVTAMTLTVATTELASLALNAMGSGYAVGDVLTLAGGTASVAGTVTLVTIQLASAALNAAGTAYVPADTITLTGGTFSAAAVLTVTSTKVVSATIDVAGTGGTPGAATVTGTTGTGTKFQAAVTIGAGGDIASVDSISVAGVYTVNPTDIAHEPVTGGGLVGAQLVVVLGVNAFTVTTPGNYTVGSAALTQGSTSGVGTGATFQTALFGARTFSISQAGSYTVNSATFTQNGAAVPPGGTGATFQTAVYKVETVTVTDAGDYTVDPANPVAQGTTSGSGTGATFTVTWAPAAIAGDMLVQPGDAIIVDSIACDHVAALQVMAGGVLQISALEN